MTIRTSTYDDSKFKIVPIEPCEKSMERLTESGWANSRAGIWKAVIKAAPEYRDSCTDGGKCGAGGYCITCHNVPAPKIGGESC